MNFIQNLDIRCVNCEQFDFGRIGNGDRRNIVATQDEVYIGN